jgi:hypothetical protein
MERSRRHPIIRMQPGPESDTISCLVDAGLAPAASLFSDVGLPDPFVMWIPDVSCPGPALVFAQAAGWWPAAAYLTSPGENLRAHLAFEERVSTHGPVARRLVLVGHSWQAPQRTATASLLRSVQSLAGWGMPSDLRAHYPDPASPGGSTRLYNGATSLSVDQVRPCGGLLLHDQGVDAPSHLLVLWRDEQVVRGWSELDWNRPIDPECTFAFGGHIFGRDLRGPGPHEAKWSVGEDPEAALVARYLAVDDLADRAVGLVRPRLIFGPVRGL